MHAKDPKTFSIITIFMDSYTKIVSGEIAEQMRNISYISPAPRCLYDGTQQDSYSHFFLFYKNNYDEIDGSKKVKLTQK